MIATVKRLGRALEPKEFCEKYARLKEGQYGYKSNWKTLLAHVLELKGRSIEDWGPAPDYPNCQDFHKRRLEQIHALLTAEAVIKAQNLSAEYLRNLE